MKSEELGVQGRVEGGARSGGISGLGFGVEGLCVGFRWVYW